MGFEQVLEKYRKTAYSERDKGARFEHLMQAYLKTDPRYTSELKEVWLWNEFPYRGDLGGRDTGIDIVAQTYNNEFWAVQCKCYQETSYITKDVLDSFLATSSRTFTDSDEEKHRFTHRLWISTTNQWSTEAENTIKNQEPPVSRLNLSELEKASIDWEKLENGISGTAARTKKKTPMKHQTEAITKTHAYFQTRDRGKLIMACGTGKTFTSLKIAENETGGRGFILFLVPSIALLGQTLNEWYSESEETLNAICICSDPTASRKTTKNEEDANSTSITDLALPASTNIDNIVKQFKQIQKNKQEGMTVVFSTYQSIEVVAKAQDRLIADFGEKAVFDLIICDEAHRTTGVILAGIREETAFIKVHDAEFIKSKKRLYMTATPRLYDENAKKKASDNNCLLCSMDDATLYGEEIYRIGFSEAVKQGLLSDYKVLVLTLTEEEIPETLQKAIANPDETINADDATKLIGCINALSKRMIKYAGLETEAELLNATDPTPMHTAVAFCPSIKASKKISHIFNTHSTHYYDSLSKKEREEVVLVESDHVDGSMGASKRDEKLSWLKHAPTDGKECRILTNVRCLSEGVDVPSLDAVMFLSAQNSQVDVVQSVGRVMRRADGKKYGYIIIPVLIPSKGTPEEILDKNDRFKVVWTVLNALRAHDDRFNAMINKIDLNKKHPNENGTVMVGIVPRHEEENNQHERLELSKNISQQMVLQFDELQSVIYARMVQKVGNRKYWEQWAKDIAQIAQRHTERITRIVENTQYQADFEEFMNSLHGNINPYITQQEAIEMLAQHIITRPVFEAIFENYSFINNNAVSNSIQKILDILEENALDKDNELLEKFYADVKERCEGIDNAEGKQKIIIELYDKFFKTALPKVVEKLGIVYTPVQVVDFIINSVADVLKKEFNRDISDKNVHILDPFTGTGTFITRLLQSGRIKKKDLKRKYEEELHANEIVLLAYYIASINIENTYHDLMESKEGEYENFNGICLTDTFQIQEYDDKIQFADKFPINITRVKRQKKTPITIIIGNPPYSVGQKSANDNAQNQKYEKLDKRVADTYVANSNATGKNRIYDTYIKAFRWASDRLEKTGGIIGFVTNSGWLDAIAMDGFRHCLEKEFSSIYVFNLRGNQRTSGELSRKEGGKIFGSGSRTPIAITILVKNPADTKEKATIYYHDIGDYLSKEEKLKIISDFGTVTNPKFKMDVLQPNEHNDWLNQRNEVFNTFIPLEPDKKFDDDAKTVFTAYSLGIVTNRDVWCYNFSHQFIEKNINATLNFYNEQREIIIQNNIDKTEVRDKLANYDTKISWSLGLVNNVQRNVVLKYDKNNIVQAIYRPFCKQNLYYSRDLNESVSRIPKIFPKVNIQNICIDNITLCLSGTGGNYFDVFITNSITDLGCMKSGNGGTQCFPLYWYEKEKDAFKKAELFETLEPEQEEKYIRHDGITDFIHNLAKEKYGNSVTKEDIFYYVYGLLHSEDYRTQFAADLKKMLPRIPLVDKVADFWAFSDAGRKLADLHLHYEDQKPLATVQVIGDESGIFEVDKMRFKSKEDKTHYEDQKPLATVQVIGDESGISEVDKRERYKVDKMRFKSKEDKTHYEDQKPLATVELIGDESGISEVDKMRFKSKEDKTHYEDQKPLATVELIGDERESSIDDERERYKVDKMRFKSKEDKTEIIYNKYIRITHIPEVAYEYIVNGRSAIEWILNRYQVSIDSASGIKNNPNDWAKEHNQPRYILDLLLSVITLSVETVKIVKNLPKLNFDTMHK